MLHRILRAVAVASLLIGLPAAGLATAAASDSATHCRDVTVPVSIAPDQPAQYQIWGQLCTPNHRPGATVQVLIHGLNYSHLYWDFPFKSAQYSYVRWANRAGYATFNLDRIGVARSSHPASTDVTLGSNAYTIHQIVAALRSGAISGRTFTKVVLVGHSYGSEIAKLEASRYRDVDALILTGSAHKISPSTQRLLAQLGQPVSEVPRLAAEVPPGDSGYVTAQDRQRPDFFYYLADADPRVVALDIATKETNTLGEIFSIGDANAPGVSEELTLPILIANGAADLLACAPDATDCSSAATLAAAEQHFYPRSRVDAVVIPQAGHVINLHRNADVAYRSITAWADHTVGTGKKPQFAW
ncbi:alpha/beta hydrolase [Kribbella pratensis]|uniref:Alpha-beta hydrolase superfamily lysophospholipase n=1 Tax=Kribbella pratensis TaxID=2512112 RepID=A0A4R8CP89_9ACTN|nr:alpha/beta fold hydrolase [Kribbella pratensis]TDW77944.1 alpha-beta hydrolase superfamily lysophospholipase [Kribbella pratensis]